MADPRIKNILTLLRKQYGSRHNHPHRDPLAELVRTILSQNTSDNNSRPAFKALINTFGSWENILQADSDRVAETIRGGGLGQIKARRIQQSLREIQKKRGSLDLNFLEQLPIEKAREWLKQLPGVGNKTANCVLLFSFGRPALPVDTHIYRVTRRLGITPEKASLDEAHCLLEQAVPAKKVYEFHVLVIDHGRQTCTARHPRCSDCSLQNICPSYKIFRIQGKEEPDNGR